MKQKPDPEGEDADQAMEDMFNDGNKKWENSPIRNDLCKQNPGACQKPK